MIKMVPCPPVCLSQGQRERQQESREAAGDAHRPLRMTHKSRKFQSESREVRHSCCDLFCCFFVDMLSSTTLVRGKNNVALRLIIFFSFSYANYAMEQLRNSLPYMEHRRQAHRVGFHWPHLYSHPWSVASHGTHRLSGHATHLATLGRSC